jgi:hypothetical protein
MPRMPNAGFCCLNAMSMFTHMKTGMDPAQSVKGGGGGCSGNSGAELCRSSVPPAHQHTVFEL